MDRIYFLLAFVVILQAGCNDNANNSPLLGVCITESCASQAGPSAIDFLTIA